MKHLFIILLFIASSIGCYADNTGQANHTTGIDTTKYVFILDGKIVSVKYIGEHLDAIEWVTTAQSVRDAVFITAGEYRKPFYMFRTRKKKEVNK
jgi:hypothetical protein